VGGDEGTRRGRSRVLRKVTRWHDRGLSSRSVACFWLAIVLSALLVIVTVTAVEPNRSLLEGSKLSGADLSLVRGLTQKDLDGACGDSSTKLPAGLKLKPCSESAAPNPGGDADPKDNVEPKK